MCGYVSFLYNVTYIYTYIYITRLDTFQDGYEYAQNAANDENSFIDIKSETNTLNHRSPSTLYLPNDITNMTNTFAAPQSVPEPDTIDGILNDDMEFQCVSILRKMKHEIPLVEWCSFII